jgi:hypothetical protein
LVLLCARNAFDRAALVLGFQRRSSHRACIDVALASAELTIFLDCSRVKERRNAKRRRLKRWRRRFELSGLDKYAAEACFPHDLLRDHDFPTPSKLGVEQNALRDGAQSARPDLGFYRFAGDADQCLFDKRAMPSISNSRRYCLTSAFFGSTRRLSAIT